VINEFGDYLINKLVDIVFGFIFLDTGLELLSNLTSKRSKILVAPRDEITARTLETVDQRLIGVVLFRGDHSND
jgi:hypothetical protein